MHFVSICSPNYLHDAHMRLALRVGADAICEKPLVINPWNLDALQEIERETGRRVNTVLQLRLHPDLVALKQRLDAARARMHDVDPDLHHRARPLVRRVLEGTRGPLRWGRHEHRHPLLRLAALALRWSERMTVIRRDGGKAEGILELQRAQRSLVPFDRHQRSAVRAGRRGKDDVSFNPGGRRGGRVQRRLRRSAHEGYEHVLAGTASASRRRARRSSWSIAASEPRRRHGSRYASRRSPAR